MDTGLRAIELCLLKTGDVDLNNSKVEEKHGVRKGVKGIEGRFVREESWTSFIPALAVLDGYGPRFVQAVAVVLNSLKSTNFYMKKG